MAYDFTANDIFEIAIQLEKNGAAFYREAAEQTDHAEHKEFLLELAAMEDDHEQTFAALQKDLSESETFSRVFDPDDENAMYLKSLADMRVFSEKETPSGDFKTIMRSAIQAEKDSIVFYLGIKEMVPEKSGKSRIDDIIKEEMDHIRILARKMVEAG
ncbi:MAG: rubrerythrin [Desulfobacteraceae bacterium]|nr:MAG: rubrerythrin [Desulfobacteraceae bacterium]